MTTPARPPTSSTTQAVALPVRPRHQSLVAHPPSGAVVQPVIMQDLVWRWVPGTTDLVRLKLDRPDGRARVIELTITHLRQVFGPQVMSDLYLKGRAMVQADPRQLTSLLELQ